MTRLEGDLHEIELVPHLLELAEERFTGAIRFENDGIIKILYFKDGDVLSASTNDRADSVDEILLRAGKVSRDHVRQALGKRKENETLGDALLSMGFISRKELTWGRRTQVVGILRSVSSWPAGSYQIVHDYLPNREEGTLFFFPQIVLELAVTDPDRSGVEAKIDGGAAIFRKRDDFVERYSRLALNEDADAIVEQIDGNRTAAEVAAVSKLDVFAVYKLLLALETLTMLERPKPEVEHELLPPLASEVVLEEPAEPEPPVAPVTYEVPPIPEPTGGAGIDERGLEEPATATAWSAPDLAATPEHDATADDEIPPGTIEPEPRRQTRAPLLIGVLVLALIGAAAWAGWVWWSGRGDATAEPDVVLPSERAPVSAPAPPTTSELTEPTTGPLGVTDPVEEPRIEAPAADPAPPSPPADPQRARYQEMAEAFAREGREVAYALQFEIVCQTESVTRALAAGPQVWFIPIQYRGDACFRVFWGRYDTREAAERARGEIPAALGGSGAVAVRPREILR